MQIFFDPYLFFDPYIKYLFVTGAYPGMTLVYLRHNRLQLGYDITASDWAIIPYIWHVWLIIFWSVILLLAYMI